jgi:hypothetical protein
MSVSGGREVSLTFCTLRSDAKGLEVGNGISNRGDRAMGSNFFGHSARRAPTLFNSDLNAWITVSPCNWFSLNLPVDWRISSSVFTGTAAAWEKMEGRSCAGAAREFKASPAPPDGHRHGWVLVAFNPCERRTQRDARSASKSDLADHDESFHMSYRSVAHMAGTTDGTWLGTRREAVGQYWSLVTEYQDTLSSEPWDYRLYRLWNGPGSFTVIVSHDLGSTDELKPILDRIANSIGLGR